MDLSGLKKKGEEIIFGAIKKTRRCHGDENYFETENFFGILDAKNGKLFVMFFAVALLRIASGIKRGISLKK